MFFETRCSWLKTSPSSVMFGIFKCSLTTTPGAKVKDHSSCESRAETQRCQRSLERKTHGVELPNSFTRWVRKCTDHWNAVSLGFDFIVSYSHFWQKMDPKWNKMFRVTNISFTKQHGPPACEPKWNVAFVQRSYSGASPVKTPRWGYEFSIWNKFYFFFFIRYGSKRCFAWTQKVRWQGGSSLWTQTLKGWADFRTWGEGSPTSRPKLTHMSFQSPLQPSHLIIVTALGEFPSGCWLSGSPKLVFSGFAGGNWTIKSTVNFATSIKGFSERTEIY